MHAKADANHRRRRAKGLDLHAAHAQGMQYMHGLHQLRHGCALVHLADALNLIHANDIAISPVASSLHLRSGRSLCKHASRCCKHAPPHLVDQLVFYYITQVLAKVFGVHIQVFLQVEQVEHSLERNGWCPYFCKISTWIAQEWPPASAARRTLHLACALCRRVAICETRAPCA